MRAEKINLDIDNLVRILDREGVLFTVQTDFSCFALSEHHIKKIIKEYIEHKTIIYFIKLKNRFEKEQKILTNKTSCDEKIKDKTGYVYLIESAGLYKIGRTKNIKKRFKNYTSQNPHGSRLIASKKFDDCIKLESDILIKYQNKKHRGEWHKFDNKDIEQLKKILCPTK